MCIRDRLLPLVLMIQLVIRLLWVEHDSMLVYLLLTVANLSFLILFVKHGDQWTQLHFPYTLHKLILFCSVTAIVVITIFDSLNLARHLGILNFEQYMTIMGNLGIERTPLP